MALDKHIAAFTNVMGTKHPEIVFAFATIPWENAADRNQFINELVDLNGGHLLGGPSK